MAITEKVTQEDLVLYEILRNPVLCTEFVRNIDLLPHENQFEYDWYQKEFMCDFNSYVSLSCARSVGKSESIVGLIIWILVFNIFPSEYIVYTVPAKVHLEPVWLKLIRLFRSNSFLKNFVDSRSGINSSDHIIKPFNGAQLLCRIAGTTGTGANVIGLHSAFEMLDESGYYPFGTWTELQPTLNTFVQGFRLIVSGVPTGLRERNVNWTCDQEDSSFSKHNISALQNPRFTEEDKQKAIEQYGGEDSDDYIHLVLGQHGKPIFALFDRNQMLIQPYSVFKLTLDGTKYFNNISEYLQHLLVLPGLPDKDSPCFFGIDLGYTEPTAICVLYLDKHGLIRFHSRITLSKVNYFIQEKLIDFLDTKFKPFVIGIDAGSAGKAVIPRLMEANDYLHKEYNKRVVPVDFSSSITIGMDSTGEEIKSKTKPFSVGILQDYTNNHKIIYSSTDLEMITELERMTYSKTVTGNIVYKTLTERGGKAGEDHFTSAMLCGSLAYYLEHESLNFKSQIKRLARPSFHMVNIN